jgi:hypothetical protein
MNPDTALLSFANLLHAASLCALGKTHEKQEEFIAHCRDARRAFLASMPIRHQFYCSTCGVEATEVALHFEDPKQTLSGPALPGRWGTPTGRHFGIDLSALHNMLSHGHELPEEFAALLKNVTPDIA